MKRIALILSIFLIASCRTADPKPFEYGDNLVNAINLPAEQQNEQLKQAVKKLANSQVPTAEQAEDLATDAIVQNGGLDARDLGRVIGLFHSASAIPQFCAADDLVWEVHIVRNNGGVTGIVWVSTTTRKAMMLFPRSQ